MKATTLKLLSATALIAALLACGGGGGGTNSPTPSPTPVANTLPVASAGIDQSVMANAIVTLDGSASSDANSDPLTYAWTLSTKPPGSAAALINPNSVKPTFTADSAGTYTATLVVNDGKANSNPDTVNVAVSVDNAAPVANAGLAQNVSVGTIVTIDGSASSDANRDPLTYIWTLTSKPAGSAAALSSATSAKPSFSADLAGTYTASLVVNDGKVNSSNAASVSITAAVGNVAPVANAGVAQNVAVGRVVTLDGSGSSDANSDPLTYAWSLTAKPSGSTSALASTTFVKPTFTADVAGTYVASLIVNDGKVSSTAVTVSITAATGNIAPVANAGIAESVVAGSAVTLFGLSSSDANKDPLTFTWTLTAKPTGSTAFLIQPTSSTPSFTADLAGTYVATLVVNDGKINSNAATVSITATAPPTPLSTTSPYITYPTPSDESLRLKNSEAALAILAKESAFVASAANDNGWAMHATYSQQGLFKVPVTRGYYYQFSTSSYWPPYLAVYDEAGYRLADDSGSYSVSAAAINILAIQSGFLYVSVSAQISPVFANAGLRIDVNPESKGLDSGQQVVLAAFGSGGKYVTGFYGGKGSDRIDAKNTSSATIYGGGGDDVIEIGDSNFTSAPIIDGGDGNDTLIVNFASTGVTLAKSALYGSGTWQPGTLTDAYGVCKKIAVVIPCAALAADIRIRNIERIQFTDKTMDVSAIPGY